MARPTQAVILAGGRGTRLRPLTDTRPKPMIEFHGKPFLEYLIELLRDQGVERVLLLLGYLPESVQAYVGDGSRWGLQIESVVSDVEDETGRRLKLAQAKIEPTFLLCYCDNYWPMPLDRMWRQYASSGAAAMLTVYRNDDGYTGDNVRVDDDGAITVYDNARTTPGLRGVEIGFGIFRRDVLDLLPDENVSFERVVYPQLVARRQLHAFVTGHRYYSVSSLDRLGATDQFLARRQTVILDRDGVLNKKPPRARYIRCWADWEWLPGAREALRMLKEAGYRTIIVSNQAGIARGQMTDADLAAIHAAMREEIRASGGDIDAIYHCSHGWDEGCECRKPKPGMLHRAQREHHLDLSRTLVIGDDERDGQAAEAAGCPWVLVSERYPLLEIVRELIAQGAERLVGSTTGATS